MRLKLKEEDFSQTDMLNEIYKLKDSICYKWIFRQSRFRNGNREIAPQGHPFIIPVEEVECYLCNSCEQ